MSRLRSALDFLGLTMPAEPFAVQDVGRQFRQGGPVVNSTAVSNDTAIPTMAGEDIADGSAMAVGPWIARRELIVGTCASLPLRVLDGATREPVPNPPPWASLRPKGFQDAFDFKWRIFDGLVRRGSAVLRINDFMGGYPNQMWALPMRWCRYNFMDPPTTAEFSCDERASVIYSPPQRNSTSRRMFHEWFSAGDPIASDMRYSDSLVGVIRMRDDGQLGGENPTALAAEVLGVSLASLREAGLRFKAPGTGTILMADDWEDLDEWVDDFIAAQNDTMNRNKPAFSGKKLDKVDLRPSPNQMQTLEFLQDSVNQIARLDNIPPFMLGKDGAGYGTSVLILRNLVYSMVLHKYLDRVETWLTARCLPEGQMAHFDTKKYLRGSEAEQEAMMGRSVRDGVRTPNEARRELDIEDHPQPEADLLCTAPQLQGERDDGVEERRANADGSEK